MFSKEKIYRIYHFYNHQIYLQNILTFDGFTFVFLTFKCKY